MKLIKNGKTKEVHQLDNGRYLLKFKDSVTGHADGTVDPGGNLVVGEQAGVGRACLAMTAGIFKAVAEKGLARTHMVSADLDSRTMEVEPVTPFGKGLEVVVRFVATGSFVRRFGLYVEEGHKLSGPLVELTLKDDQRGDPLANDDTLAELGLANLAELEEIRSKAKKIANLIKEMGAAKGLEIYDLKMEFGHDASGAVILIDEISPGSMRAYKNGARVEGVALAEAFVN